MIRALIICSIILTTLPAYSETPQPVHPDEPADYTYNERLSTSRSLDSLTAIQSALSSFKKLTETATGKLPKEKLAEIGNTGWEMQNLGFVNHVETVKGTLLKQDCLIKKLTYELAQTRLKTGEIDQKTLWEIKCEYEKADRRFRQFWDAFGIAD